MGDFFKGKRIVVTGGAGFLGSFLCEKLQTYHPSEIFVPRRTQYDLTDMSTVRQLYANTKPNIVIHLAAEVGGIGANRKNPGRFFYANAAMGLHLIEEARRIGIEKFVQVGTICAYPKFAPIPFKETDIWNGFPEETNAPYGIAKKMLLVMLQSYREQYGFHGIYLLPVNLYGPRDNFNPHNSHVIPALIQKCMKAIERSEDKIVCWGTGKATREFLYVEDCVEGILRATESYDESEPVNLGAGFEIEINKLAQKIAALTGFTGRIEWDHSKPDGQPRRCLDVSKAREKFDFEARMPLDEGLRRTIAWYKKSWM